MQLDEELAGTGHWVCAGCRSINRRARRTCYSCGASTPAALAEATTEHAAPPIVPDPGVDPTMDVALSASSGTPAATAEPPPADAAGRSGAQMVSRSDPPITRSSRGARSRDARAAALPAANAGPGGVNAGPGAANAGPGAANAGPGAAPESTVTILRRAQSTHGTRAASRERTPEPSSAIDGAQAASSVVRPPSVCPYLGIREDRSTRYDAPHLGNACHALHTPPPETGWRAVLARRTGVGPRTVSLTHQTMLCLTASHEHCPRYQSSVNPPPPAASALWSDRPDKA